MLTGGLSAPSALHDSVALHRPRGAAYPPDPRFPPYQGGAPPAVLRGLHTYDPPPRRTGGAFDTGWTPSSWATAPDPSPYAKSVGGSVYTHHAEGDSIYHYKRLAFESTSEGDDWGLNPYDPATPQLREFHAWAEDQRRRLSAGGVLEFAYPDRMPGLSSTLARTSPLVPVGHAYPEAPPSVAAAAWTTPALAELARRGLPLPPKMAPLTMVHGFVGRRGTTSRYSGFERADWAHPTDRTDKPGVLFH